MHTFAQVQWRKVVTILQVYYAYMLEYRAELLLWVLSGSLPIILMGIWIEAANSGRFGLSAIDFARYFLVVFFIRQLTVVWVVWEFEKEIVEGRLSSRLLQPFHPIWHHVAQHLAERLARLPFSFALMALFFVLYPQSFWIPTAFQFGVGMLTILLAFTLRFLIQYMFALMAFWIERANSLEQLWFLFFLFLSGYLAPLEMFPDGLRTFVMLTPFPYVIYFPTAVFLGFPVNIPQGLLVMGIWTVVFWGITQVLWRKGLKQYSGMGA
jgi:ABC-2 type transport system permease protein